MVTVASLPPKKLSIVAIEEPSLSIQYEEPRPSKKPTVVNAPSKAKLIDVKTLSQMLSISPKTIYKWVEKRQIPHVKLNALVRFDLEVVNAWISARQTGYNVSAQTAGRSPRERGYK